MSEKPLEAAPSEHGAADAARVTVRPATAEDMPAVATMIQELADFENMPDGPKMTVQELQHDGFSRSPPAFQCLVAEDSPPVDSGPQPSPIVGYALYFPTYSTWAGRSLMLEDLYVRPSHRHKGIGTQLFDAVAEEASTSGCSRLDFHVLEWNPARTFYERRGAANLTRDEQWMYYRLDKPHFEGRGKRVDVTHGGKGNQQNT